MDADMAAALSFYSLPGNNQRNKSPKALEIGTFWQKESTATLIPIASKLRCSFGGGGGNRTPVRKCFLRNLSGRRESFAFPYPGVDAHTRGLGSFIVHGALKALRTHVRR